MCRGFWLESIQFGRQLMAIAVIGSVAVAATIADAAFVVNWASKHVQLRLINCSITSSEHFADSSIPCTSVCLSKNCCFGCYSACNITADCSLRFYYFNAVLNQLITWDPTP